MAVSCERPTAKVEEKEEISISAKAEEPRKETKKMILVGRPAPTFTAPAFYKGDFTMINLEDYKGKWVLLCFYPGDFTFV